MKFKPVSIDVGGHKPIYTAPYHLHKGNDDIIEAAVDDMLRMGVVREGTSGWSSPIVLIKKPHQSSVFTTFDLSQAFWLMPLDAAAQAVTAFATATRTLLWTRCPFGVVHGPRWLNVSLRAVLAKFPFCTVYADDVVIHSSNIVEHEEHVLAVLAALADARCVLSASKMQLIQRSVKVLGHVVSAEGVAIADDDKAALLQFPRPTTVKGVRVFLGGTTHWRRYMPMYAAMSRPLTQLTRKATKWTWTAKEEVAFLLIKRALAGANVLRLADSTRPLILTADASLFGIGAELSQLDDDGHEHACGW